MSYLLEILGRGLVSSLKGALSCKLPEVTDLSLSELQYQLADDPQNQDYQLMLALKLLEKDEPLKAREHFVRVLEQDDESVPALLGLSSVHDEMGKHEEALNLLNEARLIDVLDPVILFCIGFCSEKVDKLEDAVHAYRAALRVCPDLTNAHQRLAAVFLRQGRDHLALGHYEQLVELEPENMSERLTLAHLHLKIEDPETAIKHFQAAIAMDPDNWEIQEDMVSAYEQSGLLCEAIEALQKMMSEQPEFPDNHLRLGDLYTKSGYDTAALTEYHKALELHPEYLEAMVKLGTAYVRLGDYMEAGRWFNRAVEANDRLLSACIGLGVAQLQSGRTKEGLTSLELASQIEPNSTLLFSETARMQLKASVGDQIEAYLGTGVAPDEDHSTPDQSTTLIDRQIERYQKAVRDRPDHADVHYRLGLLLKNRGRLEEAVESFRAAVHLNASYEKALLKLGLCLQELGQEDEAIRVFTRATQINPDDVQLHYQLGLLFAEKHLFELAVEHFEQAQKGMPNHPDLKANLNLALQNAGLLDRADVSWRSMVNLDADSDPPPTAQDHNLN